MAWERHDKKKAANLCYHMKSHHPSLKFQDFIHNHSFIVSLDMNMWPGCKPEFTLLGDVGKRFKGVKQGSGLNSICALQRGRLKGNVEDILAVYRLRDSWLKGYFCAKRAWSFCYKIGTQNKCWSLIIYVQFEEQVL